MTPRGLSLIDVVVGVAIMTLVFFALFGAFQLSIQLVFSTKAKIGGTALLAERMEFVRSLPYVSVGTVGGIPGGPIPQLEQVNLNGTLYTVRTLVLYSDAPEDGLDDEDENGVTADYKTVKVEVLWSVRESSRSTFAVTRVSPVGLETLEGGGTLRINVFNALAEPVPQASVRVVNDAAVPAVDVTLETNELGVVSLPGAPEASGYEITVSKSGYSSAQTYDVTVDNPNPSPAHVTVVEADTATVSFAIDQLGSLSLSTFEPEGPGEFSDEFGDALKLASTLNTDVVSGALTLENTEGVFALSGNALSNTVTPAYLVSWESVSVDWSAPAGSSLLVQLYYLDGGTYVLVPDDVLPGNSTGLSNGTHSLAALPIADYPSLQLGALLTSDDGSVAPEVLSWSIAYRAGPTPLPGVELSVLGSKTVGTTGGGAPIYKFQDTVTTGADGTSTLPDLEWDAYSVALETPSSFNIVEMCPRAVSVLPAGNSAVTVVAGDNTAHALRVAVEAGGVPLQNATVSIQSGAISGNETTSACGQAYFGGLTQATYTLSVSASGYQPFSGAVTVEGETVSVVPLIPN